MALSSPAAAEWFADGYIGASLTHGGDITFEAFDAEQTRDAEYRSSAVFGLRGGKWLDVLPWLGVALDASYFKPAADVRVFPITVLVMVVLGGVGFRWGAILGGVLYTILDQRLTVLARAEGIQQLPDVLRVPLSEPLFILGVLFILVVMFLPGGIAGTIDSAVRRRRGERARGTLQTLDDEAAEAPVEVRA